MTTTTNRPADTIRDGLIEVTIWKNSGKNGNFYPVTLSNRYKDVNGDYHDSNSFTGADPLRAARLLERGYERANDLRAADREAEEHQK